MGSTLLDKYFLLLTVACRIGRNLLRPPFCVTWRQDRQLCTRRTICIVSLWNPKLKLANKAGQRGSSALFNPTIFFFPRSVLKVSTGAGETCPPPLLPLAPFSSKRWIKREMTGVLGEPGDGNWEQSHFATNIVPQNQLTYFGVLLCKRSHITSAHIRHDKTAAAGGGGDERGGRSEVDATRFDTSGRWEIFWIGK